MSAATGFTLIELMIVMVIVAILALVALPAYQKQVAMGRRADAINALAGIAQAQERWRSNRGSYASSLGDDELKLGTQSPSRHYTLSLAGVRDPVSFNFGYIAKAIPDSASPQSSDSDCKTLSIRMDGGSLFYEAKDSNDQDSSSKCWPK
ncbi:type IV pilin protein [Paucibacter sp. TC2R-5]|uniref:type IV pilin protein n=1 Tax=Paucibacter sp. TC2R-5 TaxID=2893555 RepID=UPI0029622C8C|nr:type IV pilin protein [Paucibacter sp. TC2R-5]